MSTNPYASPGFSSGFGPPTPQENPLRGPAIAILSISILFVLILIASFLFEAWLIASGTAEQMENRSPLVSSKEQQLAIRMGFGVLLMGIHGFVIFGALSMLRLRNYGVAYAAAVISVIPCCSGCYLLGIPFGIWGLSVLNRPEVKASFR